MAGCLRVQIVLDQSVPPLLILGEFNRANRCLRQVSVELVFRNPILRFLLLLHDVLAMRLSLVAFIASIRVIFVHLQGLIVH